MILKRTIQTKIESKFFKGKAIIIYGARRVGKTTLIQTLQKTVKNKSAYLNCDEPDIRDALTNTTSTELRSYIGNKKLVFIDEAQRVKNIGLTLKLLIDNFPDMQIVATGSSSFELSDKVVEPLTGRKYEFCLYPFSLEELRQIYSETEIKRLTARRIIYGMYPEVIKNEAEAEIILSDIRTSYLFKDALQYQQIKNPEILEKLLQALALQVGSEVSYNELANLLNIAKETVGSYIRILEKAFIIFRLPPLSRNLRKELGKLRKIYFYDVGVRNALLNNFNPTNLRQDTGNLWENFVISERVKLNTNHGFNKNLYFWRTYQKQEIDYLEESAGKLTAFEIKWRKARWTVPKEFVRAYPNHKIHLLNQDNYAKFLMPE